MLQFNSKAKLKAIATVIIFALLPAPHAIAQSMTDTYTWEEIVRLVEKGDEIAIDLKSLKDPDNISTIKWTQSFKDRTADYIQAVAANSSAGIRNVFGIFVKADQLDRLMAKCTSVSDTLCRVNVDSSFLYIEDYAKSFRFLVFQDKDSKPYMRRFVNKNTSRVFHNDARRFAQQLGREELNSSILLTTSELKPGIFGDKYPRHFDVTISNSYSPSMLETFERGVQTGMIEEKSWWCHERAIKIPGDTATVEEFKSLCRKWERSAWLKLASPHRASTRPEDLGKTNLDWAKCVRNARAIHQGNAQAAKTARLYAETECEQKRKLDLLALGADPILNYSYGPGAAVDSFFASGKWRLDR